MALPTFASDSDIRAEMPEVDTTLALRVLQRVSTAARAATGKSWVDDNGALVTEVTGYVADLLREVTIEASLRRLRNPDGATTRSETLGPMSEAVTVEAGNVYFTRAERDMLAQAVALAYPTATGFTGLGTISTTRGPLETGSICEDGWIDPDLGDPELIGWA